MANERMTITERLRNPQWVHSLSAPPVLDADQTRADMSEAADAIERMHSRAAEMRHAIDMVEGALMRWPELMDLPEKWGEPRHHRELGLRDIKGNCGQLYDIYDALAGCTSIINSDEFNEFSKPLTAGQRGEP